MSELCRVFGHNDIKAYRKYYEDSTTYKCTCNKRRLDSNLYDEDRAEHLKGICDCGKTLKHPKLYTQVYECTLCHRLTPSNA